MLQLDSVLSDRRNLAEHVNFTSENVCNRTPAPGGHEAEVTHDRQDAVANNTK